MSQAQRTAPPLVHFRTARTKPTNPDLLQGMLLEDPGSSEPLPPPPASTEQKAKVDRKQWRASVFVKDALRHVRPRTELDDTQLRIYERYNSGTRRKAKRVVVFVHLMLALFEEPAAFTFVPRGVVVSVELLCVLFYGFELLLKALCHDLGPGSSSRWAKCKAVAVVITLVDIAVQTGTSSSTWQFSRLLRPFFVVEGNKNLRFLAENVVRTLANIVDVLFLQGILVVVFGTIAFIIENNEHKEEVRVPPPQCLDPATQHNIPPWDWHDHCIVQDVTERKFTNLVESATRFFVLLTTSNYPDVSMHMYQDSWWFGVYFAVFLLLGKFFLINLIVAIVYMHYQSYCKMTVRRTAFRIRTSLDAAFNELRQVHPKFPDGVVGMKRWRGMMAHLTKRSPQHANYCFHLVDQSRNGLITRNEFYTLFDILHLSIQQKRKRAPTGLDTVRARARDVVQHKLFEGFINAAIVVNIGLLMLKVDHDVGGALVRAFPLLFATEVSLKLVAWGPRTYLGPHMWNRYDVLITVLGLAAWVLGMTRFDMSSETGNLLLSARVLRVFRLLDRFSQFRRIFLTLGDLAPTLRALCLLQFCIFYGFAMVGMDLFANIVTVDNCMCLNCPLKMWHNTFDDFPTSMITLFELMVCNNWQYNMDMHVNATRALTTRLFFITFYTVPVLVMTSLLVAFILDAFMLGLTLNEDGFNQRLRGLQELEHGVEGREGLEPYTFTIVQRHVGLTSVMLDMHRDELKRVASESTARFVRASKLAAYLNDKELSDLSSDEEELVRKSRSNRSLKSKGSQQGREGGEGGEGGGGGEGGAGASRSRVGEEGGSSLSRFQMGSLFALMGTGPKQQEEETGAGGQQLPTPSNGEPVPIPRLLHSQSSFVVARTLASSNRSFTSLRDSDRSSAGNTDPQQGAGTLPGA